MLVLLKELWGCSGTSSSVGGPGGGDVEGVRAVHLLVSCRIHYEGGGIPALVSAACRGVDKPVLDWAPPSEPGSSTLCRFAGLGRGPEDFDAACPFSHGRVLAITTSS